MRGLLIATLGSTVLAAACGSAEVPQEPLPASTAQGTMIAQPAPASQVAAESKVPHPAAARVPERAPLAAASPGRAPSTMASAPAARAPEYREVIVPAGTVLALALATPVASDRSQVEDAVRATLREVVMVNGEAVLPAGTELLGRITDVERSGRVKGRARVALRFTMLRYEEDEYDVRSEGIERLAEATKGEDATKIGIGAGAGAALGALLGGGSGAVKGAAIGAAAGTGAVLATQGAEVRLEAGEALDTQLTSPLPLRVRIP